MAPAALYMELVLLFLVPFSLNGEELETDSDNFNLVPMCIGERCVWCSLLRALQTHVSKMWFTRSTRLEVLLWCCRKRDWGLYVTIVCALTADRVGLSFQKRNHEPKVVPRRQQFMQDMAIHVVFSLEWHKRRLAGAFVVFSVTVGDANLCQHGVRRGRWGFNHSSWLSSDGRPLDRSDSEVLGSKSLNSIQFGFKIRKIPDA